MKNIQPYYKNHNILWLENYTYIGLDCSKNHKEDIYFNFLENRIKFVVSPTSSFSHSFYAELETIDIKLINKIKKLQLLQ